MAENGYYSINDFPGNGSRTTFEVSFAGGYISRSHISARIFKDIDKTFVDTTFTWVNDYTIQVTPAVPTGYTLRVYRSTPVVSPLVNYSDGALLNETNLDVANKQAIFAAAEAVDAFGTVPGNDALRDAAAAASYFAGQVGGVKDAIFGAGQTALPFGGRSAASKLGDTVSVLDHIPPDLHAGIKNGTTSADVTAYFQAAVRKACGNVLDGLPTQGSLYVPNGTYLVGNIGIRDCRIVGESRDGVVLKATTGTGFILDATRNRDGITMNTAGNGWASNLTIDNRGTNRSGLSTYGGGVCIESLYIKGGQIGLSLGLPIWSSVTAVYCEGQNEVGFKTYSGVGDAATSLTMVSCWANLCYRGFHITQLYYSTFVNCVSQDCTEINWFIEGNANGVSALYSLVFIAPATEGRGVPFYFRKCRDIMILAPRVINADYQSHLMTLDDVSGEIHGYATPGAPGNGRAHLDIINHWGGPGSLILTNCDVTTSSTVTNNSITKVGTALNGEARATSSGVVEANGPTVPERIRMRAGGQYGGYSGIEWLTDSNYRLLGASRNGGVVMSSNGAFDSTVFSLGDLHLYIDTGSGTLKFEGRDGNGNMRYASMSMPITAPDKTVTGSKGGNAALASLLTVLANAGIIIDSTTA